MAKFRKKPVVVEAEQWVPIEGSDLYPMPPVNSGHLRRRGIFRPRWEVLTPEGWVRISPGDYAVCGVSEDWYPCKPDIFEKTYEPAE